MAKPRVLVMCTSDPLADPRPNRMVNWLKEEYDVTLLGRYEVKINSVRSYGLFEEQKSSNVPFGKRVFSLKNMMRGLKQGFYLLTRQYEQRNWTSLGRAREWLSYFSKEKFDVIITHDLILLPLAVGLRNNFSKVVLDAREYYPRNFDDQWLWRLLIKPANLYLCQKYLRQCDKIMTVSAGLAHEYKREFGVDAEVLMSMPVYHELNPSPLVDGRIRMIHHGIVGYSRRTERMIELMDHLDKRFTLDLMVLNLGDLYWRKILSMVAKRANVRIIPAVQMQDIILFTNQYDIGLFLCPPTNFNLKYALPNKFFEFIQARLAVAIGPSIEMSPLVQEYDCGIVGDDFEPTTLAKRLNQLDATRLMELKWHSHKAAHELNADMNQQRVVKMIRELIEASK